MKREPKTLIEASEDLRAAVRQLVEVHPLTALVRRLTAWLAARLDR